MTGGIHVDSHGALAAHRAALEECGELVEEMSPRELAARFPWLEAGDQRALWVPGIGVIEAEVTLQALAQGDVRDRVVVEAIETGDEVKITTSAGVLRARACVVAAGAWANSLLRPLGFELPLRVTREQVLFFQGDTSEMVPFVHGQGHWVYGIPGPGSIKVAEHGTGAETSPDDRSFDLDEVGAQRVRDYVKRTLPSIDPEPAAFDTCLYTSTPDGHFVLDRVGPVVVVSACSGHGFKFAPLVGEIAACLATGREPPVELSRFTLRRR
jgi:sarcosine oxidase